MKRQNKSKKNNIKNLKISKKTIFLGLVIIFSIVILMTIIVNNNSKNQTNKPMKLNFESRIEKLNTFDAGNYYKFGWLQVQGTNIDLPILDSSSNGMYESIDYSYGWLSSYYSTGDNREVLAGHNILNVSSEPMLPDKSLTNFEELMAFTYYGFAKDNLYIQYTKDNKDEIYLIYAIGFYDYYYDNAEGINDKKELTNYIKTARKNSIYDYGIDVNNSDRLIQIKTCTRMFGINEKQQFIIDARKLRDDEKILKYSVRTNKKFKELKLNEEKM